MALFSKAKDLFLPIGVHPWNHVLALPISAGKAMFLYILNNIIKRITRDAKTS
jgi:hypothetical protein